MANRSAYGMLHTPELTAYFDVRVAARQDRNASKVIHAALRFHLQDARVDHVSESFLPRLDEGLLGLNNPPASHERGGVDAGRAPRGPTT